MTDQEIAARLAAKRPCTICGRKHGEPYLHEGFCQRCLRRPVQPQGTAAAPLIWCRPCGDEVAYSMATAEPASGERLRVFGGTSREV